MTTPPGQQPNDTALANGYIMLAKHAFKLCAAGGEIKRLAKFSLVGLSGIGLSIGCMWLFTSVFGVFYIASAVVTSFLAITNNFTWNDLWTFNDRRANGLGALLARWTKFALARSVNFFLGLGLLVVSVELIGMHYLVATIIIIGTMTFCNYVISLNWVWREAK